MYYGYLRQVLLDKVVCMYKLNPDMLIYGEICDIIEVIILLEVY